MSAMTSLLDQPDLSYMDRVYVNFALGKAHEDNKNYVDSFVFYRAGNSLKKTRSRYSAEKMSAELNARRNLYSRVFCSALRFWMQSARPNFYLGFAQSRFNTDRADFVKPQPNRWNHGTAKYSLAVSKIATSSDF